MPGASELQRGATPGAPFLERERGVADHVTAHAGPDQCRCLDVLDHDAEPHGVGHRRLHLATPLARSRPSAAASNTRSHGHHVR